MLWFCHIKDCGNIEGWVIGHDDRISDDNRWIAGWKTLYDHYPYFNGRRIIMHFTGKDLVQSKDEFERKLKFISLTFILLNFRCIAKVELK